MRLAHIYALTVLLSGCTLVAAAVAQECIPARPAVPWNMANGVDWSQLGQAGKVGVTTHPRVLDFVESWIDLPARIEQAVWYGGFAGGCMTSLLGLLVVGYLSMARKGP